MIFDMYSIVFSSYAKGDVDAVVVTAVLNIFICINLSPNKYNGIVIAKECHPSSIITL